MIDLHTHVLPGLDDGPADLDGSIAMLRSAAAAGTETVVATPHVREDYLEGPEAIGPAVVRVQDAAAAEGLELGIVAGAEVAATMLMDLDESALDRLCLGEGRYILVESPYHHLPIHFADSVFDLQLRGYHPVLAHPERCVAFIDNRALLAEILERGVHTSITAGSMTGQFGGRVREITAWLFAEGFVSNVASDAHDALKRPPGLRRGFDALDEVLPGLAGQAAWYTREAPAAMLAGAELPDRPEPPRRRSGALSRLRPRAWSRS
ncbi:MAG TPA: CpsB/CapC family capsule biosynthesis tyrosine phosphatase [Thermoleophilaceae bacterium]|nr:CpsB/CapC family capsule biosynthesis tyrosine phosphatase [Thermoleophilaceae bacterium]